MRTRNKIISGLLLLLGFSGCDPENGIIIGPDMYGPGPVGGFTVKGKVTDADEKPIEGIRVVIRPTDLEVPTGFVNDTIYTDASGIYQSRRGMSLTVTGFSAAAADVDGPENGGEFLPAESNITIGDFQEMDGNEVLVVKDFILEKKTESENEEK